jgi:hypothetical protein
MKVWNVWNKGGAEDRSPTPLEFLSCSSIAKCDAEDVGAYRLAIAGAGTGLKDVIWATLLFPTLR